MWKHSMCRLRTPEWELEFSGDQSGTFYGSGYYRTAECRWICKRMDTAEGRAGTGWIWWYDHIPDGRRYEVSFEAKIAVEGEDDSSDDEDLKPSDEPSAEPTETPDDSEAPSAGDNADASLEAQSLDVIQEVLISAISKKIIHRPMRHCP